MADRKRWIVTAAGDRPLKDIKESLQVVGFDTDQVLDEIGCITGSASESAVKQARKIPGVADVSPETSVDIGPPDVEAQ